jgi:ferric-dicitrate binding protein FerR (iron transport regulator)
MHRPAIKDISLLIARGLLKVSGDDEKKMLSEWKNISERNAAFVRGMEEYWNLPVEEKPDKNLALSRKRLFVRLTANESKSVRRAPSYYLRKIAAILIFILSIAGLSTYIASETGLLSKNNWICVSTGAGQQSKVALPDGSTVWLNAETEVKYHSEKKIRKVYLTGEAYFEVEHAPNHPFVVETGNAQIKY